MLLQTIQAHLPEDWHITNLIFLDPGWQVNICDGEWVIVATGETIEEALDFAATKTLNSSNYIGRLAFLPRLRTAEPSNTEGQSLLAQLGLLKPPPKVRRI